jgi:hypothetical protein
VSAEDTLPSALRASDQERENVIVLLQHGSVDGRLSNETFLRRLDVALRAQSRDELAALLRDLPAPVRRGRWLTRPVHWGPALGRRVRRAWHASRMPELALPRGDRIFVIGRSPDSDLALANRTVSWRHAELRPAPGGWLLVDLGSTNGTHVNGWRAGSGFQVVPGDWVRFGATGFRIVD